MLRFAVITLFPELIRPVTESGVTGRAVDRDLISVETWNPRDFARDRHRTVDDRAYGGGPGMVMQVEPLGETIRQARSQLPAGSKTIYLSPQGRLLDQALVEELAAAPGLLLVAGRYEGVDERLLEQEVDLEVSIGDYVLSGGELPAMVVIDALARLQPGALGHAESASQDSFSAEGLLDHPHFTRPETVEGRAVPPVLLGGDHEAIRQWRLKQALGRTWQRRPDLLARRELSEEERRLLDEFIAEQSGQDGATCSGKSED
ncbi:tRNA (guanine37-N1)-methyltransferase [Natronospira proteinivora]|uniref:tRNA (guanine-N(1)-)-methyltransferase n=1 Tax=Natronospira proteinivora TaxID=1807133 RepID=A0ABT1G4X4_9GAMM|nr:tRNA (guanosine(37)-N1)-methyltransferase TrmD [Natronospira proteinivora]MCP1726331.1 tRNA (guanine37-N1)-methyltransferase [Natronospira proteinivora]